jgi:hypothetical protein
LNKSRHSVQALWRFFFANSITINQLPDHLLLRSGVLANREWKSTIRIRPFKCLEKNFRMSLIGAGSGMLRVNRQSMISLAAPQASFKIHSP